MHNALHALAMTAAKSLEEVIHDWCAAEERILNLKRELLEAEKKFAEIRSSARVAVDTASLTKACVSLETGALTVPQEEAWRSKIFTIVGRRRVGELGSSRGVITFKVD